MSRVGSKALFNAGSQPFDPFKVALANGGGTETQTITFPVQFQQPPNIQASVEVPAGDSITAVWVTAVQLLQSAAPYTSMQIILNADVPTTGYILDCRAMP